MSKSVLRPAAFFLSAMLLTATVSSCILESNIPLSDSNNFHEAKFAGNWVPWDDEKGRPDDNQDVLEIKDTGKTYSCRNLKEEKGFQFILTKLDSFYFISARNQADEPWLIFRIEFAGDKFLVRGLNKKGQEAFGKISERRDNKNYVKISQAELQKWCLRNAGLFTAKCGTFKKQSTGGKPSVRKQ